jgi:hypothetical protein
LPTSLTSVFCEEFLANLMIPEIEGGGGIPQKSVSSPCSRVGKAARAAPQENYFHAAIHKQNSVDLPRAGCDYHAGSSDACLTPLFDGMFDAMEEPLYNRSYPRHCIS